MKSEALFKSRKIILLFLAVAIAAPVWGQGGIYRKKYEELVDFTGHNRLNGFHFAPGLTYALPPFGHKNVELGRHGDTVTTSDLKGKGQIGFYFEAGMYHLLKYSRFFRYLDWSIAYKNLKGSQNYQTTTSVESSSTQLANGSGTNAFRYNFLTANVNLNNIWQIGNYSFIQNSLGLDFNYAIGKKEHFENPLSGGSTFNKMIFSLHYKLGYGFKVNSKLFIIPALETPILNFIPFEKAKSTIGVFDMRYRPLILTIRIAWLRKPNPFKCPTPPDNDGDKRRQEQYQMSR